jgi:alcohol dehydrogenase
VTARRFNLIWLYDRLDLLTDLYNKVDGLSLGPPLVGKVFGFEEMPAALAYLQSGRSVGKVVVAVQHVAGKEADGQPPAA